MKLDRELKQRLREYAERECVTNDYIGGTHAPNWKLGYQTMRGLLRKAADAIELRENQIEELRTEVERLRKIED